MENKRKRFIVYKTTNLLNGKVYIGKHETYDINDDYLGSGKILKYALKKYGSINFKKEIIILKSIFNFYFPHLIYNFGFGCCLIFPFRWIQTQRKGRHHCLPFLI